MTMLFNFHFQAKSFELKTNETVEDDVEKDSYMFLH